MHFRKSFQRYKAKKKAEMAAQTELERRFMDLSPAEAQNLLVKYEKSHNTHLSSSALPTNGFADFMKRQGLRVVCPYCHDYSVYKHGTTANGKPRYRCNSCSKTFTPFVGTLVQGSSLSWEIWVYLVYITLHSTPLAQVKRELEQDYDTFMTEGTILAYRHKIQKAIIKCYPMPKLSGVVQVDETYFREGQKGSRNLINVAPTAIEKRVARTQQYTIPSKLGINSPEFACVVTGIDSSGYIAAVVTGLGKGSSQPFEEYFSEYLGNVTFLCSDGYEAYKRYAENMAIPHYVQKSEARELIKRAKKDYRERYKVEITDNVVRQNLYGSRQLDYIDNYQTLPYNRFEELKREKGLNLDRIDSFHRQLKRHINKNMCGVSTIYLPLYIGLYVFIHNWNIEHKSAPSSKADAEQILINLLTAGGNFISRTELENQNILNFSRPTTKYINYLKNLTDNIRNQSKQMGFTIDDNDRLLNFNKRKYFENTPKSRLKEICKEFHIKGYTKMTTYQLAREICALPNVNDIFLRLVAADSVHAVYTDNLAELLKNENR